MISIVHRDHLFFHRQSIYNTASIPVDCHVEDLVIYIYLRVT